MTQPELDFSQPKARATKSGKAASRMIAYLFTHPRWVTRREFRDIGLTDRECRLGRRKSHGRIIYGQAGYKLTALSMSEEISTCLATTISMIQELQADYSWLKRRAHKLLTTERES